ncbi:MAG: hypothetical protein WCF89_13935, partial [Candidatus Sulfotelmatobacter sp.]
TRIAWWSGHSHNGYLELGLAGGILSAAIFLIGIAEVFRACLGSAPGLRRRTLSVFVYMISIAFTGITFTFPSYFGLLILTLLYYVKHNADERTSLGTLPDHLTASILS